MSLFNAFRVTFFLAMIFLARGRAAWAGENITDVPTVGIEGAIEAVLPAANLQAAPLEEKPRLILRIAATTLTDDGRTKYDLRYIGLAPGSYNLANYLVAPPGQTLPSLPAIPVTVKSILPENHEGGLVSSELQKITLPGGYTFFFVMTWVCWALLLIPLIFVGRPKKQTALVEEPVYIPTLADLLRPLVQRALDGQMTLSDKTHLERLLMNYWCTRLHLGREPMITTVEQLKQHPQAGELLRHLEHWLHEPPGRHKVDLAEILSPYQKIAADDPVLQGGEKA
ncbi:MAG: hypothetical protein JW709_01595 [Sedimentisphaerales bacterium]|nr:hypothetical protein [Sedimentisphaerales bacterium]